jgi:hypothetical protein
MAKKTEKAAAKAAPEPVEPSGGAEERHEPPVDGTAATDDSRALPDPRVRAEGVEVLRSAIESFRAVADGRLDDIVDAVNRSLSATSEIRERGARNEVAIAAILSRVTVLEENQRPPAPAPEREAVARKAACRWTLANHCRARNFTPPTAAIVGRVMHDERAFDERTAKSPQELFRGILDAVRHVFGLPPTHPRSAAGAPSPDYVHLTEKIVEVVEERSSIPKKKQSVFLNDELKLRLNLLANSGLAHEVPKRVGKRINYDRFLTPMGREVFEGWPDWADKTGGISLADEQMPPDPGAAGRPIIGATGPASPPPEPSPPRPPSPPPLPPSPPPA